MAPCEGLDEIRRNIEAAADNPTELFNTLESVVASPWPYEKGDLSQWVSVLDIVDAELGKEESSSELKVACLKITRQLLENCSNRHVYNTYEHLTKLLGSNECPVVMAVLRVLSVLATPRSTRQVLCEPVLISRLTALASIWVNF
ncbi:hypothetical protein T484DRAFT_1764310 [Baffinella frigidus]|nr:hypothetical protein T484DRAFT_1764310 [Cryptophyta sp. CCMP2293]